MNCTWTWSYSVLPLAFEGHQFLLHSSRKSPHSFTVMFLYRIDSTPKIPTCSLTDQKISDNVTQMLNTAGTNVLYWTWSWDITHSPKIHLFLVSLKQCSYTKKYYFPCLTNWLANYNLFTS